MAQDTDTRWRSPRGKLIRMAPGFCWDAFFFGGLWALRRGLWQKAAQLLIAWTSMAVADEFFIRNSPNPILVSSEWVFFLAHMYLCGKFGHAWWRDSLLKQGYTLDQNESPHEPTPK